MIEERPCLDACPLTAERDSALAETYRRDKPERTMQHADTNQSPSEERAKKGQKKNLTVHIPRL